MSISMNSIPPDTRHIPILLDPITDFLSDLSPNTLPDHAVILDCTLGGGGHTARLLEKIQKLPRAKQPKILAFDQDPSAIARNEIRFAAAIQQELIEIHHLPFGQALTKTGNRAIVGILADLGISSDQIDSEDRGFSFRFPAPLDMRMNTQAGETLAELLARISETDLADLIWKFGEDRMSRKIARRLIQLRSTGTLPKTSSDLAEIIAQVFPPALRYKKIHPATKTFQAFRIYLNQELDQLETLLNQIVPKVHPQGRIAILTFHSLEDRMVKHALRNMEQYELPSRKAIVPSEQEQTENSRSRSAKLRLAIRK